VRVLGIVILGVLVCIAWGFRSAGIAGAATGLVAGFLFSVLFAVATNQNISKYPADLQPNPTSWRLAGAVGLMVIPISAYVGGWTLGWAYALGTMAALLLLAVTVVWFIAKAPEMAPQVDSEIVESSEQTAESRTVMEVANPRRRRTDRKRTLEQSGLEQRGQRS
jgi:hypothetical protein